MKKTKGVLFYETSCLYDMLHCIIIHSQYIQAVKNSQMFEIKQLQQLEVPWV